MWRRLDGSVILKFSCTQCRLDWHNLQGEKRYNGVNALKHESIANDMQILRYATMQTDISWYLSEKITQS